ncbi:U3 snoRNP-associated protein-like YAO [Tanacetum coccineum]
MRGSKDKAQVLYAPVEVAGGEDRLLHVCGTDLSASGGGNGIIHLWEIESDAKGVAGVGKEPRLARWGSLRTARHGVALHPLHLS